MTRRTSIPVRLILFIIALSCAAAPARAQADWRQIGLSGRTVTCIAVTAPGAICAGTSDAGIFRSTDGGTTWEHVYGTSQAMTCMLSAGGDRIFAGYDGFNGLVRSTDGGRTWDETGALNGPVTSLALNTAGHVYAGATYVSYSTDGGASWSDMPWFKYPGVIQSLGLNWGWKVFAITTARGDRIARSTDNSNHWDETVLDKGCRVLAVRNDLKIFVGADSGMYRSDDNSDSWIEVNAGLGAGNVRALALAGSDVYAGTSGGVYRTSNDGRTWSAFNGGLNDPGVRSLAVSPSGTLYAGTAGGGVYASAQPVTSVTPDAGRLPAGFALLPNSPNPFPSSTRITFTLASRSAVELTVYDGLGRRVATLEHGDLDAGAHAREWDASGLPAGIYVCRLEAGKSAAVRVLSVVR